VIRLWFIFSIFILFVYANDVNITKNNTSINTADTMDDKFDDFEDNEFLSDDMMDEFSDEFTPKQKPVYDPLEGYNRLMTGFNDYIYLNLLGPVSDGWASIMAQQAQDSMSNFFDNLLFPVRFINNILQGKLQNSIEELERFVINTTIGFFWYI